MQAEDCLDENRDAGGRAAELAEEPPGLEGGNGLFDEGPDFRVGAVDCLLALGQVFPPASVGDSNRASGTRYPLSAQQGMPASESASMMPFSRAARMSCTAPGKSAIRSIGSNVPSRITNAFVDAE
jgi:hypothetical protein